MVSKKNVWEKTKYIMQILPDENTGHGGNGNQNWEFKILWIDYTKHGKHNVDIIREPYQKIFGYRMYPRR